MDVLHTISKTAYNWGLFERTGEMRDSAELFLRNLGNTHLSGFSLCFLLLMSSAAIFSAVYYFMLVKPQASNDTTKNYLLISLLGLIFLWVANFVSFKLIINQNMFVDRNMLWVCLIDIVYYVLFFQLFSWLFKPIVHSNKDFLHLS